MIVVKCLWSAEHMDSTKRVRTNCCLHRTGNTLQDCLTLKWVAFEGDLDNPIYQTQIRVLKIQFREYSFISVKRKWQVYGLTLHKKVECYIWNSDWWQLWDWNTDRDWLLTSSMHAFIGWSLWLAPERKQRDATAWNRWSEKDQLLIRTSAIYRKVIISHMWSLRQKFCLSLYIFLFFWISLLVELKIIYQAYMQWGTAWLRTEITPFFDILALWRPNGVVLSFQVHSRFKRLQWYHISMYWWQNERHKKLSADRKMLVCEYILGIAGLIHLSQTLLATGPDSFLSEIVGINVQQF